uniref:XRCC4 coiled-coil domain-containing protein n=1 Tax=Cyprinodon variegatus TaxID=28743 RepID=A0A3Q2E479_CYPVA
MHTSVREIHFSSQSDVSYFLRLDWEGRSLGLGFSLMLTDGQKAWKGKGERQSLPDFIKEKIFAYFKLGSVLLDPVKKPAEAVTEVLIHTLQRGNTLQEHNRKLMEENQRLIQEHQRIIEELKHYAEGKEALEAELYSRFVLVLNEKKAKIRSLKEAVTTLQETRCRVLVNQLHSNLSTLTNLAILFAAMDDEYGGSTDEEQKEEESTVASQVTSRGRMNYTKLPLMMHTIISSLGFIFLSPNLLFQFNSVYFYSTNSQHMSSQGTLQFNQIILSNCFLSKENQLIPSTH